MIFSTIYFTIKGVVFIILNIYIYYSIKTIINELSPPSIYSPEKYPFFKYFILTKNSSKDEFIKKLEQQNIYIFYYINIYLKVKML